MKTKFILCMCILLFTLVTGAQVTQINSNKSLHVKFPIDNTKTIVVSDIDSTVWVSDATLVGTVQISTSIKYEGPFALLSGKLIFRGHTAATGSEVFITDGTPGGTILVKDIYTGTTGSLPAEMVPMNGFVYFTAATAAEGRELWRTDGSPGGTTLVKDIVTGTDSSNSIDNYQLFNAGTYLLFAAKTASSGIELWRSDGSGPGTVLLKDINTGNTGADSSNPAFFYRFNSLVLFIATDAPSGREVWKTDGTPGGTMLLKDINIGPGSSTEFELFPGVSFPVFKGFHTFNSNAYFGAFDGTSTGQVWKTDGNPLNTSLLKDIVPGMLTSTVFVSGAVNVPGKFIFSVSDGSSSDLWESNGTPAGTALFMSFTPSIAGMIPFIFVPYNYDVLGGTIGQSLFQGNKFFFSAGTIAEGSELWISDGSLAGTNMVKDIYTGPDDGIDIGNGIEYVYTSTTFFFNATDGTRGNELWRTDGTSGGTTIVQDIYLNANNADPELNFITNGTKIIFSATDGNDVNGDLFVVDGNFFPIPVKLLNFTVSLKTPDALLSWSTMQEVNTKDFTIQRSFNGTDFYTVGRVASKGNTAHATYYSFLDPGIANYGKDIIYYRLLISDRDGKTDHSKVIALRLEKIKNRDVQLLTNPVSNHLDLLFSGDPGKLRLSVVDAGGRIVYDHNFQNVNGQLSIPASFGAGLYMLIAERNTGRTIIKFIKQ